VNNTIRSGPSKVLLDGENACELAGSSLLFAANLKFYSAAYQIVVGGGTVPESHSSRGSEAPYNLRVPIFNFRF
jgi:hypothetical protein